MTEDAAQGAIDILLADDQSLVRMGFRMVLEAEPDLRVVGEACDGRDAVAQAAKLKPDVVLMDVRMPNLDGISATREILAADPHSRVIVLTTFDLDEYAFGGLRAGASGFLVKDARPAELLGAIRSVASGEAVVSPRVTKRMLELFGTSLPAESAGAELSDADRPGTGRDPTAALTPRELEVLLAMADGLSNQEIARKFFLTESTVKTHVGRVLFKLGLRDRIHAVIFAYENGLVAR